MMLLTYYLPTAQQPSTFSLCLRLKARNRYCPFYNFFYHWWPHQTNDAGTDNGNTIHDVKHEAAAGAVAVVSNGIPEMNKPQNHLIYF